MSLFNAMNVSASGMTAQRVRMDIISQNIANVNSTRDAKGDVYTRKLVVFNERSNSPFASVLSAAMRGADSTSNGVKVTGIIEDKESEYKMVYNPSHPDADENGYVTYSNVNTVTEMTDLIDASRSYEANVTAFNAAKSMALKGLEVGK